jgi:hypothetical protein
MAIGLGISNSYNTKSPTTTAWEGTLDAISAGILLYTGLVEVSLSCHDEKGRHGLDSSSLL